MGWWTLQQWRVRRGRSPTMGEASPIRRGGGGGGAAGGGGRGRGGGEGGGGGGKTKNVHPDQHQTRPLSGQLWGKGKT